MTPYPVEEKMRRSYGYLFPTGPPHDEDRQDLAPEEREQRLAEHVGE
jgi:hypothetical protein